MRKYTRRNKEPEDHDNRLRAYLMRRLRAADELVDAFVRLDIEADSARRENDKRRFDSTTLEKLKALRTFCNEWRAVETEIGFGSRVWDLKSLLSGKAGSSNMNAATVGALPRGSNLPSAVTGEGDGVGTPGAFRESALSEREPSTGVEAGALGSRL